MISFIKYCSLIIILVLIQVICNPICYNWCPPTPGYAVCCDYYPGQNIYPGPIAISPYSGYSGGQFSYMFCPEVDCTKNNNTELKNCTNDDDCLRKETCCNNPCEGNKKCFITAKTTVNRNYQCPKVTNCTTWRNKNVNAITCNDIDDCKRSETCCKIPCTGSKVCQNITRSTNTGIGTIGVFPCNIETIC